jgi:hypothetical protein
MNKPDCNITRKFLKREKGPAEKIRRFIDRKRFSRNARMPPAPPSPVEILQKETTGPTEEEIKEFTNKSHTRKITRFMHKLNPGKIRKNRARYLNGICSDSGVCMAFGPHANKIKKHFGGFVKFDNVSYLKKIGAVSANGFVKEIEYDHDGYKSHAVLKSSADEDSDNLYYEYLVGTFLNVMSKLTPTFLETYGLFNYKSIAEYEAMKKLTATKDQLSGLRLFKKAPANVLQHVENPDTIRAKHANEIKTACVASKYVSILIQHVKGANTLKEKTVNSFFVKSALHYVLFQVYWTLYVLKDTYTHYDLHTDNVLIYEPVKDAYIHYFYHYRDGSIVSFKSKYIAKIIDYGRCYFNFNLDSTESAKYDLYNNSNDLYTEICKDSRCNPGCGYNVGFSTLNSQFFKTLSIESRKRNVSHDLRLLTMLPVPNPLIHNIRKKVVYKKQFGTPEKLNAGYPNKIHNVVDAMWALRDAVIDPTSISQNEMEFGGMTKLGEMHIYEDRPLEYIPSV